MSRKSRRKGPASVTRAERMRVDPAEAAQRFAERDSGKPPTPAPKRKEFLDNSADSWDKGDYDVRLGDGSGPVVGRITRHPQTSRGFRR